MKFCEKEDFSFPDLPNCMVYFLLKDEEVVYVGKTTKGIVRPLSHNDKDFDSIKVLFVGEPDLDSVESHFIAKYRPKYNSKLPGYFRLFAARNAIREEANSASFSVATLKRECKKLNINILDLNGLAYISAQDVRKIICELKSR